MTIQTLLIPTDGSERSVAAARRGFDLAAAFDAEIYVLSVADSSIATGTGYSGDSPSIRRKLRETARKRVATLREEALDHGISVTTAVREGIPANEIVSYAREAAIDAVVMGTAGRGGVARTVIGSVTDKVVRTAGMPVITISPTAVAGDWSDGVSTMLLPTDGSELARAVATRGLDLAGQVDAAVHFLSVIDEGRLAAISDLFDGDGPPDDADERDGAADHLETLTDLARERRLESTAIVRVGDPPTVIVEYADSEGIDLIVLGTAGRGGFERLLMGSVADRVIRTAPVPVLTIRPPSLSGHKTGERQ